MLMRAAGGGAVRRTGGETTALLTQVAQPQPSATFPISL